MKHKVLIVGAGRIGCGYGWPSYPFVYTHLEAWAALSDRVEIVGVCDKAGERLEDIWPYPKFTSVGMALGFSHPSVVSICTQPEAQKDILSMLSSAGVKGVWCEKPYMGDTTHGNYPFPIQVNYIRRFDTAHQQVKELLKGKQSHLHVWAKDEIHTKCHFDDLMKFWGCSMMTYLDNSSEIPGTNSYRVDCGKWSMEFRNGGVSGDFMVNAAKNLLDHIDHGTPLISPAY